MFDDNFCFRPYMIDCNGDIWVPDESMDCGDRCWCWDGCPRPTGAHGSHRAKRAYSAYRHAGKPRGIRLPLKR